MKNLSIGPTLSIIIVSYNCRDFLVEAINSIYQYVDVPCEIIVVDNASSDTTPGYISTAFPDVKLIANAHNAGFSMANNQGAALATGKYLLLLNPDAKLINRDWKKALDYLERHPRSIIGPRILNPDLSLQDSVIRTPGVSSIAGEAFFLSYFFRGNDPEQLVKEDDFALSGACLLLHRADYERLGGLDEALFWMDDVDLCYRARQAGLSLVYFRDWTIVHVIGQSSKRNYSVSIANQVISKLKFFKKHRRMFSYYAALPFLEFHVLSRLVMFLATSLFSRINFLKFKAYLHTQILLIRFIFTGKKRTF